MKFKCMWSYFFCQVQEPAVMNRKFLKKKTSVCNENANYSGFFLPNNLRLNFGLFSTSRIYDAKCGKKRNWSLRENLFQKETKIWAAGLKPLILFYGKHLPQRSWRSRTRLKSMFTWENCSVFSSRYCSWEVGKKRCKLRVKVLFGCLAQSSQRPFLPSEVDYLLKSWGDFSLNSNSISKQNREASLLFPWYWKAESPGCSQFPVRLENLLLEASRQVFNA